MSLHRVPRSRRPMRLHFETLEDRTVPAAIDLTTIASSGAVKGVVFQQANPNANTSSDEILHLASNQAIEQGYNSKFRPEFDESSSRTRTVRMIDLVPVTANGITYRVLQLNMNDSRSNPLLSLDELRLYVADVDILFGYNATNKTLAGVAPVFDMGDNFIKLDGRLSGGRKVGDMFLYIPQNLLLSSGTGSNPFVYLYSKFGVNFPNSNGGEVWGAAVGVVPPPPAPPANGSLSGHVFWDANGNGLNDDTNTGIPGTLVTLTGTTTDGESVELVVETDSNGTFTFIGLKAGTYSIAESQPSGFASGVNTVGTVDGVQNGTYDEVLGDRFFDIHLSADKQGINYDFAELLSGGES
jgi:hypothetical protein